MLGTSEGESEGYRCDNSSFISMLVCWLFVFSGGGGSPLMGTTLIWMEYRVILHVCDFVGLFA